MKKLLRILIISLFIFIPSIVWAINPDYKDNIAEIVGVEKEEGKVNLYLFHRESCPHCKEELKWLEGIKEEYKDDLNVYTFEVENNKDNMALLNKVFDKDDSIRHSVPLTIVGDEHISGFSDTIQYDLENLIKKYVNEENNEETKKLPFFGEINVKNISLPLVAIVFGFIDGFNPCAMWVLLFLINMIMHMENKSRRWIYGFTFLFVSGLVYFISMLGINLVLTGVNQVTILRSLIGIVAIIAGGINLRSYVITRKQKDGCTVVDDKKRKRIIHRIKKIDNAESFILAILGIAALAVSVNLIELACSLGFPAVFTEILAINDVKGVARIMYLLLYTLMYMIDDIIVFVISMVTLEVTGITNKYSKLTHLIGGIIMLLMGILLIFKPEWIMLNFG